MHVKICDNPNMRHSYHNQTYEKDEELNHPCRDAMLQKRHAKSQNMCRLTISDRCALKFYIVTHLSLPKLPVQFNLTDSFSPLIIHFCIILHYFFTSHDLFVTISQQEWITSQQHFRQASCKCRLIKSLRLGIKFWT